MKNWLNSFLDKFAQTVPDIVKTTKELEEEREKLLIEWRQINGVIAKQFELCDFNPTVLSNKMELDNNVYFMAFENHEIVFVPVEEEFDLFGSCYTRPPEKAFGIEKASTRLLCDSLPYVEPLMKKVLREFQEKTVQQKELIEMARTAVGQATNIAFRLDKTVGHN